jgi:transposase
MYFKSSGRHNPQTGAFDWYYRLVESYRNTNDRVCHRTILNIGFLDAVLTREQLLEISRLLTLRYEHKIVLFDNADSHIRGWTEHLWQRIVNENRLDLSLYEPKSRKIDADTMRHTNVREIGAEWIAWNSWQQLGLDDLLAQQGFSGDEIRLAQTQVISRAVYPASELATTRWIQDNSAVCELTGFDLSKMNKDRLYRGSLKLFSIKEALEKHLSVRTNELFDLQDKVIIYDLTNTYFEGSKRASDLAKFGRSKEKRTDARQIVLALVVNVHGFVKHSSIHEGNYADSTHLDTLLNNLGHVKGGAQPGVVVIDAGIATKDNLKIIRNKGYDYVCVSRQKLKDYRYDDTAGEGCQVRTRSGKSVSLRKIIQSNQTDFVLEVNSEDKGVKERAMKSQMEERFEVELEKINASLTKKSGIKTAEKVYERLGRLKEKYPSVHRRYNWDMRLDDDKKIVTQFNWGKNPTKEEENEQQIGRYFLRTSLDGQKEETVWQIYNAIREVESTFRTLKTELDLRPIYHQNDDATQAHLHLGVLAYSLVNTIRYQLKSKKINCSWTEIVRIGNTQKMITTQGYNAAGNLIQTRKCSEPIEKLKAIQQALAIKSKPFKKEQTEKSVVHSPPEKTSPQNAKTAILDG